MIYVFLFLYVNVQLHSKLCNLGMCSLYTCVWVFIFVCLVFCMYALILHSHVSTTENCVWSQCYHL